MLNLMINRAKRGVVMTVFLGAAIWLSWRGERYDDRHNSALPALMCAVEAIVLVITGAAISLRRAEAELEE
jgi:hypothetical protein